MRYKKCKLVCGLMVCALMMTSVTACGTNTIESSTETESTTEANTFAYTDGTEEELVSTTVMAKVDSVDGNKVTLSVGGGMGAAPDGNAPEKPSDSGDDSSAPEKPDDNGSSNGDGNGSAPEKPSDNGSSNGDGNGSAPEKPDDNGDSKGGDSNVPEKPDDSGDSNNASENNGSAPEKPSDDGQGAGESDGNAQQMPGEMTQASAFLTINDESVIKVQDSDNNTTDGSLSDITEGTMIQITFDEEGNITEITVSQGMAGGQPGGQPGGTASGVDSYDAVTEYAEDTEVDGESYSSTGTDENAIFVSNGATATLKNIIVDRTSSDSTGGDNSSFYGVGAAVLTTDGTAYVKNADITTNAAGGAGVFAYGDGIVYIADSDISTEKDTSGGIHAAGGGTLYAWDLNVETQGESSAAIRSDRGGGTMVVDGGTYTSNGTGSPAVYCTADIAVNNATLTANGSEAICMEGLNTIHLFDCDITGDMQDLSQNDTTWTIIVYQSMSGDSEVGNSTMQIVGGSFTSKNGGLIYTTNTEANILLSDVDITYSDDSEFFLMCTGNTNERGWGTAGANGSDCTFTADDQDMEGTVIWDSISDLDFYMTNGSTLTGYFVDDETYAGNGGDGYCNVYISDDSTWTVTGDSEITNLYNEGTIVDVDGKTISIVGTDGTTYVEGTSSYTITVEKYSDSADFSGAVEADSWTDHEVAKPEC